MDTAYNGTVVLKGNVYHPRGEAVRLQTELRRLDEYGGGFIDQYTQQSDLESSGATASITVYGLIDRTYHWRARTVDAAGIPISDWLSAGGNPDSDTDFVVSSGPPPVINPTIAMTPVSGPPGTTFTEWGTGFTPNSYAVLHFKKPDGTEYPTRTEPTDSIGHFEITYTAPGDTTPGTYTWWAIDSSGAKSNEVTFVITQPTPGQDKVALLVRDAGALDADESHLRDFLIANTYSYDIIDVASIKSGAKDLSNYNVLYMRTGVEPAAYQDTQVIDKIRTRVQDGARLILEYQGLYLGQYMNVGNVYYSYWGPAVFDSWYFVEAVNPNSVFSNILSWSPPTPQITRIN